MKDSQWENPMEEISPPPPIHCEGFEAANPAIRFSVTHFCGELHDHKGPHICETCNTQFESKVSK